MKKNKHRLWGMRCYLCGSMDKAEDRGEGWRSRITPFLERMGVVVLNPCDKPIKTGIEDKESTERRKQYIRDEDYESFAKEMKLIRHVDLRLVDLSDFIIVNLDINIPACGTYEELFLANKQLMPVLLRVPQGLDNVPHWIWGMLPKENIFSTWKDLKKYLNHINRDNNVDDLGRWVFFDYSKMIPKISIKDSIYFSENNT